MSKKIAITSEEAKALLRAWPPHHTGFKCALLKICFWSCSSWSSAASLPGWREQDLFYKQSATAEGIRRQKTVNWQKTGNRAGCHDHFTVRGCCQQHLDEQGSQLCSSLVALQKLSGKCRKKRARCREWCWLVLEKLHGGLEECGSGMVGSSSKVHDDTAARHNVDTGQFCKNPRITHWMMFWTDPCHRFLKYFYNGCACNNNNVRIWIRLGNWVGLRPVLGLRIRLSITVWLCLNAGWHDLCATKHEFFPDCAEAWWEAAFITSIQRFSFIF